MTEPQQPPPAAPAPATGAPAAPQDGSNAERIAALERKQDSMDGKLDQLLARLPGSSPSTAPAPSPSSPGAGADPGTVQQQMREAIRAVAAEDAAAAAKTPPPPEQRPREPGIKGKARWQRRIFGQDPGAKP